MSSAKDVILKHIEAFNARDRDAEPWAADGQLTSPVARLSGREDIIGFFGMFWEAFPDIRIELRQLLAEGSAAAAEGTLTGTHNGVLPTPKGDVAATGRAVELRWAAIYAIDGDTIKAEHLFFDQMDFLGQLGLLPQ
ncbi:MAG TPA: nuclear transport factor 2 family protein [Mycobacterium sp.]